ncbi:MAG: hypothetical protein EOP06_05145 [Proteobacteria bacterium]|nr:MAG: hypothetical protein EOP06_05145 [Pseudomonadota bacterium]
MFEVGQIITYSEMCAFEAMPLQRGMHFDIRGKNVLLMSTRNDAPFNDVLEEDGRILVYEGHNIVKSTAHPRPARVDQPMFTASKRLTENGKFYEAAKKAELGAPPVLVRVYEKLRKGLWVFNGVFELAKAEIESRNGRQVFLFHLRLTKQRLLPNVRGEPLRGARDRDCDGQLLRPAACGDSARRFIRGSLRPSSRPFRAGLPLSSRNVHPPS